MQSSALPLGYAAMERKTGFEPATFALARRRSTTEPLPHIRFWCLEAESNHRHEDFQSSALPTELSRQMATRKGLEPSTSSVTGWHSNHLNYRAKIGGHNRARTYDPLLVRQVLSQLSYAPSPCRCFFQRQEKVYNNYIDKSILNLFQFSILSLSIFKYLYLSLYN